MSTFDQLYQLLTDRVGLSKGLAWMNSCEPVRRAHRPRRGLDIGRGRPERQIYEPTRVTADEIKLLGDADAKQTRADF